MTIAAIAQGHAHATHAHSMVIGSHDASNSMTHSNPFHGSSHTSNDHFSGSLSGGVNHGHASASGSVSWTHNINNHISTNVYGNGSLGRGGFHPGGVMGRVIIHW